MLGLARHLVDLLRLVVIASGPLPFGLVLARATRRPPAWSWVHAALVVLTVWCVLQVFVGLSLGIFGHYALTPALVAESVLFLAGLTCSVRPAVAPRSRHETIEHALLFVGAIMLVSLLARVAMTPISDDDSLGYHLPAMATWYEHGSFVELEGFSFVARYPFSWEVLSGLFVMPFREDFLVAAPNLVAWSVFGLSICLVSLELGAGRPQAMTAALLALAAPIVRKQMTTMHVDLALGASFMAALYFAITFSTTPFPCNVALLLGAVGMMIGVKTTGLVYASVVMLACAAVTRYRGVDRPARTGPLPAAVTGTCALVTAAALLVGAFWYARNAILVGNPLGVVKLTLGGRILLPGPLDPANVRQTTLLHLFDVGSGRDWRIVLDQLWVNLGAAFVMFVGLACAWRPARPRVAAGLGVLVAVTGLLYCATPFSADNGRYYGTVTPWFGQGLRYALPFAGVSAVCGALGASSLGRAGRALSAAGLMIALAGIANRLLWGTAGVVLLAGGAWAGAGRMTAGRRRLANAALVVGLAGALVGGSFWMRKARSIERVRQYGGLVTFIEAHVAKDETIGYTLTHRGYVLYGTGLDRSALRVRPPSGSSVEWADSLRHRDIHLLVVGPIPEQQKRTLDLEWLDGPGAPFVKIYGHDSASEIVLYRLVDADNGR